MPRVSVPTTTVHAPPRPHTTTPSTPAATSVHGSGQVAPTSRTARVVAAARRSAVRVLVTPSLRWMSYLVMAAVVGGALPNNVGSVTTIVLTAAATTECAAWLMWRAARGAWRAGRRRRR